MTLRGFRRRERRTGMDGLGLLSSVWACPCLWGPYREEPYLQGGGSEQRGDYHFPPRALRRAVRGPVEK